ncbi:MAG: hypothetical protein Q4G04_02745 [bacterium]|nr:hypothetical protein [bacterium]
MSVFKIEKTKDFTVMSNYHLRDKSLTYKAKGLLSFMLSLPEDWDYSLAGLTAISKESRDGIRSILKELQTYHYLEIEKVRGDKGYFEYNYLIYEKPHFIEVDNEKINPDMQIPHLDNPNMEIPTQINTNKQIDKGDKTKSSFFVAEEHNSLTLNLINRGYLNEDDIQIYYYDKMYENLLDEENSYKDLLIISDYVVNKVNNNDFKDEEGNYIRNKFGYLKEAINANIRRMNIDFDNLWGIDDNFEKLKSCL